MHSLDRLFLLSSYLLEQKYYKSQQTSQSVSKISCKNETTYIFEFGIITHTQKGCLNLVIASRQMIKEVYHNYFDMKTDTTSNHNTIITKMALCQPRISHKYPAKFQFKKLDKKVFQTIPNTKSDLIRKS